MFSRNWETYRLSSSREEFNFQKPGPLFCLNSSAIRLISTAEWSVLGAKLIQQSEAWLLSSLEIKK